MLIKFGSPTGGSSDLQEAVVIAHTNTYNTINRILTLNLDNSDYGSVSDNKLTFSKACKLLIVLNGGNAFGGYTQYNTTELYKNGDVVDSLVVSATLNIESKTVLLDVKAGDIIWIYQTVSNSGNNMSFDTIMALEY